MKVELSREELLLLRHCVEFNTTGTRNQGGYEWRTRRLIEKLNRAINPSEKVGA